MDEAAPCHNCSFSPNTVSMFHWSSTSPFGHHLNNLPASCARAFRSHGTPGPKKGVRARFLPRPTRGRRSFSGPERGGANLHSFWTINSLARAASSAKDELERFDKLHPSRLLAKASNLNQGARERADCEKALENSRSRAFCQTTANSTNKILCKQKRQNEQWKQIDLFKWRDPLEIAPTSCPPIGRPREQVAL